MSRKLDKACRDLERERLKMQMEEKKLVGEIKKAARNGQMDAARAMAKDLARTKSNISKTYQMRTQLQSVKMQMSTMRTHEAMTSAMANAGQMMAKMNNGMNVQAMHQVLMNFGEQQQMMEMQGEMMDDVFDADGEESEEANRILDEVLTETGLEAMDKAGFSTVPSATPSAQVSNPQAESRAPVDTSAIDEALNNLKR